MLEVKVRNPTTKVLSFTHILQIDFVKGPEERIKRGILVEHTKYGLCTVGGFDRKKQTISLHAYRDNKRLTQSAKVKDCRVLTWVAFRSWLVAKVEQKFKIKGSHPAQATKKGRLAHPQGFCQGFPQVAV